MIANMLAFGIARHWQPMQIYEALLLQDGIVLPHGNRSRKTGMQTLSDIMPPATISAKSTAD